MNTAGSATPKRPRRNNVAPELPPGKRLVAVEKSDETRVVFLVPVAARTVREVETQGLPVVIRYPWARAWYPWPGAPLPKMRRKVFDGVPLADPDTAIVAQLVMLEVSAKVWRDRLGASQRSEFERVALPTWPEDGDARVAFGPFARDSIAAGVLAGLAGTHGVAFKERLVAQ